MGALVFRNQGDEEATKEYINVGVVRSKETENFRMTKINAVRGQIANDMEIILLTLAESIVVNPKAIYLYLLCSLTC